MSDHRAVGLAAVDAARDAANRWVFPELVDEGLEPWSASAGWRSARGGRPPTRWTSPTSSTGASRSLAQHRAYLEGLSEPTDPDEFLRGSAGAAGERFGGRLAVVVRGPGALR